MVLEGLLAALQPSCLLLMFIGVTVGIIFGSIPGLSASMAVVLFLPMSFGLEPVNAIALLVALYVGGISGGLISAILLNIPGTSSSVPTLYDGHPMALNGEAGKAIGAGILYSFIGTFVSCIALLIAAPTLAKICLQFTPVEYFSITIFSMTIIASLAGKSILKGLISGILGWSLSLVGISTVDGYIRYTFGSVELLSGFNLIPILIGFYAVAELFISGFNRHTLSKKAEKRTYKMRGYGVSMKEFLEKKVVMISSAVIGVVVGILPGLGGGTAGNMSYAFNKNISKYPEKYGTGIVDGVIASETANNATIGGGMIPMLTMGIPGTPTAAILMSGLMIHSISPGPLVFVKNGATMYGIMFSLLICSILVLIIERGFLPGFVKILDIPKHILMPCVVVICTVGAYAANGRIFDVWCVLAFALFVMVMKYFRLPNAPFVIALSLGDDAEMFLGRAMSVYKDPTVFFTRPISLFFIIAAVVVLALVIRSHMKAAIAGMKDDGDVDEN